MSNDNGDCKVLDFGLSKILLTPGGLDTNASTLEKSLTSPGAAMGTIAYMSPEQVRAKELDDRTDLFSFGVVLYEMATGVLPFRGESSGVIFEAILNPTPVPPVRLNPEVTPELERIITKCLEKNRDLRYQNAADVRTDLQHLKRDTDSARMTGSAKARRATAFGLRWKLVVPAAVAFLVLSIGSYFYFHRTPKLTDKDTIVLADFINKTGDPVFDDTLRQGLSVEPQQSPFLSLISDRQVQQQMSLMGQQKEARLTSELAQQICERTASAMVVEGSIASLGSQYVLGLCARNCNTGNTVDQEQLQVARREDVLNSLSQIARKFRTQMGESLARMERNSTPLAEATTPSLEAQKDYSTGRKVNLSSGTGAAIPLLRRAVEIDPKFAMAYAFLGLEYSERGESVWSAESTAKGWQLRDRVSDQEKFFIDFTYDRQVTGNLEKAYQTLKLWLRTYPRGEEPSPLDLLGGLSTHGTGRFQRAIEASQKQIAAYADVIYGYHNLASSYFFLDRFGEAGSVLQQATELNLEEPYFLVAR
jgi:eukaryotic-like serine/threonine-protein kinase